VTDPLGPPIRYEGYGLAEKHSWTLGGMGPAATEPAATAFHALAPTFEEISNDVRHSLAGIGVQWTGQAAQATGNALNQAAQSGSQAGQTSRAAGGQIEQVGQSWERTKARIPPPIEVKEPTFSQRVWDAAFGGMFGVMSDYNDKLAAAKAADVSANDALRENEQTVRQAVAAFPDVTTRPPAPGPGPGAPGPVPGQPPPGGPTIQPTPGGPNRPAPPTGPGPGSPGTPPQQAPPTRPPAPNTIPPPANPPARAPNDGEWIPLNPGPWPPGGPPPGGPPRGRPRPPLPPPDTNRLPGQPRTVPRPPGPPPGAPGMPDQRTPLPGRPAPGTPSPSDPGPGIPGPGGPGSGGSGPGGLGPGGTGPGTPGQPQSGVAPMPGGGAGPPLGGRSRGAGDRPGRSEGDGYDFGDLGTALAEGTVAVLGIAGGVRVLRHFRKHGADNPPQRTTLERRIDEAARDSWDDDEHDPGTTGRPSPAGPSAWGNATNGPYALNVGGNGRQPVWLDPTTMAGVGFIGPGAFGAMRSCWLSILLRIGNKPPGRVIIPVTDAIRLLGTSRPDTVPEGLYIVDGLDHARAALDAEIRERAAAPPDHVAGMPMVALMLAEAPADPTEVDELAELLHAGRRYGVIALIGDDWPEGATLEIDQRSVVSATHGGLDHLCDAFLFHQSLNHIANACQRIDPTNQITAERNAAAHAVTTSSEEATHAETETTTTGTHNQLAPHTPHEPSADPTATATDVTSTEPDHQPDPTGATETSASAAAAHLPSAPSEPETHGTADPEHTSQAVGQHDHAAGAAHEPDAASPSPDRAAKLNHPGTITVALSGEAGEEAHPPSPRTIPIRADRDADVRPAVTAGVVRLELMHIPRLLWLLPPGPVNISPTRGKTQMEVLVNLAVNREGQLRAAAAAALWPDTNIERPTNTFNSYRTRLRAFIKDKTNGTITELVQDNEDGTCQLDPNLIQVDYWEFLDAIDPDNTASAPERARAYLNAVKNYRGSLAQNIDAEWISEIRDHTQTAALQAAIDLAHDLTHNHDDPDTAVTLLDKAATFDPYNEPLYQKLITLLRKLGRPDAAKQRHDAFAKALDRLDGLKPLPETTALLNP
jgi:DNA-binding SARP family transcriptional activator